MTVAVMDVHVVKTKSRRLAVQDEIPVVWHVHSSKELAASEQAEGSSRVHDAPGVSRFNMTRSTAADSLNRHSIA